jgi:fatty-acyl-CoA synthase
MHTAAVPRSPEDAMLYTEKTIGAVFEEMAAQHGDRDFIVYPDRNLRFTWREFEARVDRLAKGLLALGLRPGDHLGIWARNVPDWLTFLFATAKTGVVLVTVNTAYRSHELAYVMKQSDMKALAIVDGFRDVNYVETVYELVPELRTRARGNLNSEDFPALRSVIFIGQEKHRGMYNMPELFQLGDHQPDDLFAEVKASVHCDDVVNMQYTSGTTGFPKGVMLTHRNILNNGYFIGERQRFTEADRLCLPVPLFHCFGIVLGVMAVLTHGGTLVLLETFEPLLALAAVQKERCTALYGVPTMFIAELNHPMFDLFDLTSLRTGIMAGSPCPIEVMKKVISAMHCEEITIAYGLTEASPVITQTSTDDTVDRRVSTVGTALPGIEVKITDPETGATLGTGEQGELCCRGYNVMKGYYNMPEATASAIDADGWLHSGDLAACDEAGYYRITGRSKDMIIRGGENIYPREIEEFLYTVPGIEDAQVVGVPDDRYGEVVGAFVVRKEGADLTAGDIRDFAIARIARYKVPKHLFFVDEYPITANGKIQKYRLREMAAAMLQESRDAAEDA